MIVIGNIFLVLATLIYVIFLAEVYDDKTDQSRATAIGSQKRIVLLMRSFLAFVGIAALSAGMNGGFEWISDDTRIMWTLAGLGILCLVFVTAQSARFRFESGAPWGMHLLTGVAPFVFPATLLLAMAVLLNAPVRALIQVQAYKMPLLLVVGVSLLAVVEWVISALRASKHGNPEFSEKNPALKKHLAEVAAANPMKPDSLIRLLTFTDSHHPEALRAKALQKMKSNPNWTKMLVEALKGEAAPAVFTFLASNTLEDRTLFADPVREGILQLAAGIRKTIRQATDLRADQFSWDIDRMLATVENFKDMEVDYLPAMREVRAALDEPCDPPGFKQVAFKAADTLDWWIRQYAKTR